MQLISATAQGNLFHPDRASATVSSLRGAKAGPLRLIRNGGRLPLAPRGVLVLGATALVLTAFLSPRLLPRPTVLAQPPAPAAADPRPPVRAVGQPAVAPSPPVRGVSDGDVAAALQAAGALSDPLPGRAEPLRFLNVPDLPPIDASEPTSAAAAVPEPARPEPVSTASLAPREPLPPAALPARGAPPARPPARPSARPERAAPPVARPHPVVLAARGPKPAARPEAGGGTQPPAAERSWTLPRSLLPTDP